MLLVGHEIPLSTIVTASLYTQMGESFTKDGNSGLRIVSNAE